jgi:hypothetical protein
MAIDRKALEPLRTTNHHDNFDAVIARVLSGARDRIQADIRRAEELGIIDEHGNRVSKEWPPEMQPPKSPTGPPLNLDDHDWRF